MKHIKYLYLALISSFLFSCYSDKGNYDYNQYPETVVTGIKNSYDVVRSTTLLEITPEVKNEDNFTYAWKLFNPINNSFPMKTIAETKNLSTIINEDMGNYYIHFVVTSKDSGYEKIFEAGLSVSTATADGFYILKEDGGMGEIDLLANSGLAENIMSEWHGSKMKGVPTRLSMIGSHNFTEKKIVTNPDGTESTVVTQYNWRPIVVAISNEDMRLINPATGSALYTFEDVFYFPPTKEVIPVNFIQGSSSFNAFFTRDEVYYKTLMMTGGSGQFGDPTTVPEDRPDMDIAPSQVVQGSMGFGCLLYDNKYGRFLSLNGNWGGISEFNDSSSDTYPSKDLDFNLLYMGPTGSEPNIIVNAIMEKKDKSERYIFALDGTYKSTNPIFGDKSFKIDAALFKNAKVFGHNWSINYLYFSTGDNKVHIVDVPNKNVIEDIVPNLTGEVTFVRHIYYNEFVSGVYPPVPIPEKSFNYLVVATYNAGEYKLYMYETVGGRPDTSKQPKITTGKGKVVGVQYASSQYGRQTSSTNYYSFD